jgi:riboflavin biosynthesis pyrimidine reductase
MPESNLTLQQLYPCRHSTVQVFRLYLQHSLHRKGSRERPYVYTNYVTTLDGRIALEYPHSGRSSIPAAITSEVDQRLYQELAAQADVLLTSGRYLRQLGDGTAQHAPPVSESQADLLQWRREQGMAEQPALVILTRTLDLPLDVLESLGRKVYVATGSGADKRKLAAIAQTGATVLLSGNGEGVDGCELIGELGRMGYTSIYSIAGPVLLDTLLRAGKVDRLYLTQVHMLFGGQNYDTLLEGPLLEPAAMFYLESLYYDMGSNERPPQSFAVFGNGRGEG